MRSSWLVWCAPLGLVACAGSGPRAPAPGVEPAAVTSAATDAAVAPPIVDAAVVDAAVDAPPVTAAEARQTRMRTPRSAQVNAEDLQRLAESRARFDALAREHDGSYVYVAGFGSWTSADAVTTVRVRRGVVVERSFEVTRDGGRGRPRKRLVSWTETGAKVGSHQADAEPALLMDERYDACAQLIELSAHVDHLRVAIDFDERGLLARCGSEQVACSDPCWQGTNLRSLTFGP